MRKILTLPVFFLAISLSFAQTKFAEQKVGHVFYITIPDYLVKTITLNDVAQLQYMNTAKDAYVIVIEDDKENLALSGTKFATLKDFHDSSIKSLKAEKNSPVESSPIEFKQNGYSFYQSDLNVNLKQDNGNDLKITYLATYVESKTHFYQILCWTLAPTYKELVNDFKKIATSIRD